MLDDLWVTLANSLVPVIQQFRERLSTLHVSEKPDKTLLTEADLAVEARIVDVIRSYEPGARIIAEESGNAARTSTLAVPPDRVWVIDPIDGTAEFVQPNRREFCNVVCLLFRKEPIAAFVLAPELGFERKPLLVVADRCEQTITIDGVRARTDRVQRRQRRASVTRSTGTKPRTFEAAMGRSGYILKTRTTSQTLDMVRTALDINMNTDLDLPQFDLFFRERQKLWDGVAGLCIGLTHGLIAVDAHGDPRLPVDTAILSQVEPTFSSTIMGPPEAVEWFLKIA